METVVESTAPRDAQRSGAALKKDAGSGGTLRDRSSKLVLFQDLLASLRAPGFWLYGAWIDTSLRFRSQALGAFWMVASTLVFVLMIGTLYSRVLRNSSEIYYAHIATGFVLWAFIQGSLQESTRIYFRNRSMIQNGYVKYVDYVLRMVGGNLINLAYTVLVAIGAVLITPVLVTSVDFVLLLTVPLFMLAVLGMCYSLSVVGARYPDIAQTSQTILRLFFFITPIIWMPTSSGRGAAIGAFMYANPFYYLVEIIRGPLVYSTIPWFEIGIVAAAIPVIWLVAALVYARAKPYVPLWI